MQIDRDAIMQAKEKLGDDNARIIIEELTKCVSPSFLKAVLEHKEKIIVHATFTGYGRSVVEPCVPPPYEEFDAILQLVKNGFPRERIVIRIDPIIPTVNLALFMAGRI